jgi:hypothetical protein
VIKLLGTFFLKLLKTCALSEPTMVCPLAVGISDDEWILWNYRFLLFDNRGKDVICFTHPSVGSHALPVSCLVRVSRFRVFLLASRL